MVLQLIFCFHNMKYWVECISEALDDAKLIATEEQIQILADWVSGAHENYGMAFGYDCISSPLVDENKELKEKLSKEKRKITCN